MGNPIHTDFLSRAAIDARDGLAVLRRLEALATDYVDLEYTPNSKVPITADDAVGTLAGIDPADLAMAVSGIGAIGELLSANDGQLRKAFKRLSQFAR